jgi:hypothetical protein
MVTVNNKEQTMNERIREIIEQAGFEEKDGHISIQGVYMFNTHRMEKFAELIVRECIDCLKPLSRNHSMVGAAQDTIREHFGVEE